MPDLPRITFTDILATLAWAGFVVVMIMMGVAL